jgi:hypothetical protein
VLFEDELDLRGEFPQLLGLLLLLGYFYLGLEQDLLLSEFVGLKKTVIAALLLLQFQLIMLYLFCKNIVISLDSDLFPLLG